MIPLRPGPAFQECTGSCHKNFPAPKAVSSDLRSTDGLTVLARIEIVAILVQPSLGSPRVDILLASPVQMLVHCVVNHSRPPDGKSSSNVSLPFAWITGPETNKLEKNQVEEHFVKQLSLQFNPV